MGWDVPRPNLPLSLRVTILFTAAPAAARRRRRPGARRYAPVTAASPPPQVDGIDDIAEWTNTLNKLEVLVATAR